ncbi:hypothetical protein KKG38_01885 [Patescibacteria group bacterium]|nr:hypothetical protein [Patescibacteria group bacterium]
MKKKIKEWFLRYFPAEIAATFAAVFSASFFFLLTQNRILAAYAGALGENFGFYGTIFFQDYKKTKKIYKERSSLWVCSKTIQHLCLEFGFSEILDSFFIRPFCMYWFSLMIPFYTLGVFVGKFVADIIFYSISIFAYEIKLCLFFFF